MMTNDNNGSLFDGTQELEVPFQLYNLPFVFYIELFLGFATILLRLVLYLPCFYIPLQQIRRGWERVEKGAQHNGTEFENNTRM
jgi:hypothetical protein